MENNQHRILLEKRKELTAAIPAREAIAIERLPDMMDDIQSSHQRELALVSINSHWKMVRAIDEALQRIDRGTYGVCEVCEEQITPKRMQAVPWAILCRACQEAIDAVEANGGGLFVAA